MKYVTFYSWQSDNRKVSNKIEEALQKAFNDLKKEGISIEIDKANRNTTGSKTIEEVILEKIRSCDFFIADLTPVSTFTAEDGKVKLMPNSNALIEYGYALRHLGEGKTLIFVELPEGADIHQLPFDFNHRTINVFSPDQKVKVDKEEIKDIIRQINEEMAARKPEYGCAIEFEDGRQEIELHPIYKKIYFHAPQPKTEPTANETKGATGIINPYIFSNPLKAFLESQERMRSIVRPQMAEVTASHGKIYYSRVNVSINLRNLGAALDDCDVYVYPVTKGVEFYESNEERYNSMPVIKHEHSLFIDKERAHRFIGTLVPDKCVRFGEFYIGLDSELRNRFLKEQEIIIEFCWEVFARQLKERMEGRLQIRIIPDLEYDSKASDARAGDIEIAESVEPLR